MTSPGRLRIGLLGAALLAGCGGKPAPPPPVQSVRARESALARSGLPGAAGIGAALRVSDSAAARQQRLDSVTP